MLYVIPSFLPRLIIMTFTLPKEFESTDEHLDDLIIKCDHESSSISITREIILHLFSNYLDSSESGPSLIEKENKIIKLFQTKYFKELDGGDLPQLLNGHKKDKLPVCYYAGQHKADNYIQMN